MVLEKGFHLLDLGVGLLAGEVGTPDELDLVLKRGLMSGPFQRVAVLGWQSSLENGEGRRLFRIGDRGRG